MQYKESSSQLKNDVQSLRRFIAQLTDDEENKKGKKFGVRTSQNEEESKILSVAKREVNNEEGLTDDANVAVSDEEENNAAKTTTEKGEIEIIEQNGETTTTKAKVTTKADIPAIKPATAVKLVTNPKVITVKPTTQAKITKLNIPPAKPTTAAKNFDVTKGAQDKLTAVPHIVTVKPSKQAKVITKPKIATKPPPPPTKLVTKEKVITATKTKLEQKSPTGAVKVVPSSETVEKQNESEIVSVDTVSSVDELCSGVQCMEISVPLGRNKDAVWALGSLTFLLLLLTGAVLYTGLWKKRHGKLKRWQKADKRDSLSVAALLRKKSSRSFNNGHYANCMDNNLTRIAEEDSTDEDDVI
ncbi:uncharacterized protein LOC102805777 isoform X2 [Saccoglossus kowalevskii]